MNIGKRTIGAAHPPFFIAEMSGNHNGKLDSALEIVRAVAASGASAIKLQTFTPATLTIDSSRPEFFIDDPSSLWHGRRLWELYTEAHTPWEWHAPIFEFARDLGLSCISSAFDLSSVEFLQKLGVDAIKIASLELVHLPLIAAAATTGKPLILSTGMSTQEEIEDAVATLRGNGCEQFVLLKCTSAYPAEEKDANLNTMRDMATRYRCLVGFSDHNLRPYGSYVAIALGGVVVEKHVTLRRSDGGVDAAFSLEPAEVKELVDGMKLCWQSCGVVKYAAQASEETSLKERPSIYIVRPVAKDEAFTEQNTRIIRPGAGMAPKHYYPSVIGRKAARDIGAGVPLSWDMIEEATKR